MINIPLADEERVPQGRSPSGSSRFALFNRPPDPIPPNKPSDPNRPSAGKQDQRTIFQRLLGPGSPWRWLTLLAAGLLVWQVIAFFFTGSGSADACTLTYGTFYQYLKAGQVQ